MQRHLHRRHRRCHHRCRCHPSPLNLSPLHCHRRRHPCRCRLSPLRHVSHQPYRWCLLGTQGRAAVHRGCATLPPSVLAPLRGSTPGRQVAVPTKEAPVPLPPPAPALPAAPAPLPAPAPCLSPAPVVPHPAAAPLAPHAPRPLRRHRQPRQLALRHQPPLAVGRLGGCRTGPTAAGC